MTTFTTQDREEIVKAMYRTVEPIPFAGLVDLEIKQGTEEWHQIRLGKVTASRVADVMSKVKTGESAGRKNYKMDLVVERLTNSSTSSFRICKTTTGHDKNL